MYQIHKLDSSTAGAYERLTFPNLRPLLYQDTGAVAIGAKLMGLPIGLAVTLIEPETKAAHIVSLMVLSSKRGKGVGTALIHACEKEAQKLGCTQISASYNSAIPTYPALEHLLLKAGWDTPKVEKYAYQVEISALRGKMAYPGWLKHAMNSTDDFSIFNWSELQEAEKQEIKHLRQHDPRYQQSYDPLRNDEFEPLNSLGLRYKNEVVGWQITYRDNPQTIRYGSFFVRSDLRNMSTTMRLIIDSTRRQVDSDVPLMLWNLRPDNKHMLDFVSNFLKPYSPAYSVSYYASKTLESAAPRNLADLLRRQVAKQPEQTAFTFLTPASSGELIEQRLTYSALNYKARQVAEILKTQNASGEQVLICLPPGLDYIATFFGCLYAGAVAVLAYPPDLSRPLTQLEALINDTRATVAFTTDSLLKGMLPLFSQNLTLDKVRWFAPENLTNEPPPDQNQVELKDESLAFLLYTSGSTGASKGVMITHARALENIAMFPGFENRPVSTFVSWLPMSHTMGMFFGILHPLYRGLPAVLMHPLTFLQRPIRWLDTISKYKEVVTAGSNFAFDLCTRKIRVEERAGLDLSAWSTALMGGDPIRAETIERFLHTFAPYGLRPETMYPSYGMSEATCSISGSSTFSEPLIFAADKKALENNQIVPATDDNVQKIVSCGKGQKGQTITIVNPDTLTKCMPGSVGEIWLSGQGLALGYWSKPEATAPTFEARLADGSTAKYLRTGDLGFLLDGELFITGRLKDLIIIRGRNYYPQDIELIVEAAHPQILRGGVAAFSLEVNREERLVVLAEVETLEDIDRQELVRKVSQAITQADGIELYNLTLLKPGAIPKTPSGKIQRRICHSRFSHAEFEPLFQWQAELSDEPLLTPFAEATQNPEIAKLISNQLVTYFARKLGVNPAEINSQAPFAYYGLVSVEAVNLVNELEKWLSRPLPATLLWDYPSIEAVSQHLAGYKHKSEPTERSFEPTNGLEPIAIVGIGCRFPGAKNLADFWQLLVEGRDAIGEIPAERWDVNAFYDPEPATPAKVTTRWGGFLEHLEMFDPSFFGISPREAHHVDPRQRVMLEVTWEALEDAGIAPEKIAGSQTGVYVANLASEYGSFLYEDLSRIESYSGPGAANSVLANRLSYFLDLRGPSVAVDTACSGSLVAIHQACQSLRQGETDLFLAGGVNIILRPDATLFFSKAEALASDGRCKTFDARADGMVRSEGAAMIVLKRLSDALAANDQIYAVVRGSAINSDGRSKGIMAPNRQAQEAVLRSAYKAAGIQPSQVQYIEAHGTGTRLGDPIEVQALGAVLSEGRPKNQLCAIGSVKTNVGHTEATAGMAGIIKVALSLKHRRIPASLHYQRPNPLIPFHELPLVVQSQLGAWQNETERLIAGVSAFGFGGTNAHIVLEEAPPAESYIEGNAPANPAYILPLSAQTKQALVELATSFKDFLAQVPDSELKKVAYTAAVRRKTYPYRLTVVGQTSAEISEKLTAFLEGQNLPALPKGEGEQNRAGVRLSGLAYNPNKAGQPAKLVFVFSGQGSHWLGMGRQLFQSEPVFRTMLESCDRLIQDLAGWSLLAELNAPEEDSHLNQTDITQPAIFAVQVSLAALWYSRGIMPDVIVGQSLGEVAAAYVSGALSLEEAVRVVVERSRLMKRTAGQGKTAYVELPLEQAQLAIAMCDDVLAVAGSNSPTSSVLSGDPTALERILNYLERKKIFCRLLPGVDVAFHSPQMEVLKPELIQALAAIKPRATNLPVYSTVTGNLIEGSAFTAAYWGDNLREPFLFTKVIEQLAEQGYTHFLEVSPHPVLATAIVQGMRHFGKEGTVYSSLKRGENEQAVLLSTLGTLYTQGHAVKWERLYPQPEKVVSLPTYPFQKERYWFDQIPGKGVGFNSMTGQPFDLNTRLNPLKVKGAHPLLDEHHPLSFMANGHIWTVQLNAYNPAYLADHKFQGMVLLPGAAFIEMGLAAIRQALGENNYLLKQIEFKEALILPQKEQQSGFQSLQIALTPDGENSYRLQISSQLNKATWKLHAVGTVELNNESSVSLETTPNTFREIQSRCPEQISGAEHYQIMAGRGLQYGPSFQAVSQIWRRDGESLSQINLPLALHTELSTYRLHPVLLDAAFQTVAMAFPDLKDENGIDEKFLPVGLGSIQLFESPEARLWCHTVIAPDSDFSAEIICANLFIYNEQGREIAQITNLQLKRIKMGALNQETINDWLYELQWQPTPRPLTTLTAENPYPEKAGSWLIFSDKNSVGEQLKALLEAIGETCWMLSPAENYHISEQARRGWLNPAKPEDFQQFLTDSLKAGQPPYRGIVHLWGLDKIMPIDTTVADLEQANVLGSIAILHIAQAVTKLGWSKLPRLWLVTRGSQTIQNELTTNSIAQFPLWGFGGTLTNELPELGCVRVDLSRVSSTDEVQALFQELWVKEYGDQIALRGNARFVQRIVHYQPKPQPENEALPAVVYPDATYLITGGLGGLGLAVTLWMVQKGARHLVLMSRRTPGEEIEAKLDQIRALGAEIIVAPADVSNEAAVNGLLCRIEETMPPLKGIIHSALVLNDALIPDLTIEKFDTVMKPKLAGAWHLHNLTLHLPLDFFVMFSSVASLVGSAGQGNYVAGSSFLDGLVHYRKSQGLPALCINWGPWSEVGFAAQDDQMRKRMAARGVESLTSKQGLDSFELLLQQKATQVGVIRANWNLLHLGNPLFRESSLLNNLLTETGMVQSRSTASLDRSSSRTKIMETVVEGRLGLVETYLCEIIAEVMGLLANKLDTQQSLYDMGFDSLVAVEIKNRIETDLLVVIPVSQLMQGPSISQLAGEVLELFMLVLATLPQLQTV